MQIAYKLSDRGFVSVYALISCIKIQYTMHISKLNFSCVSLRIVSYIILGGIIMKKVIKAKLEEIVALLNDPEETVMDKEIQEKLEKIVALLNNPNEITLGNKELKEKLEKIVLLVNKAMVDPDIDIEYYSSESDEPHILVTYIVGDYNKPTRKIALRSTAVHRGTPEEIANQITFSIEEFKGEIDSVGMG